MSDKAMVQAQSGDIVEALTDEMIGEWLAYERDANDASDNTLTAYRIGMQVFSAWCSERGVALSHVAPTDVVAFKAELTKKYKPQTVNLRLTAVRAFYRFLVNTGRALINPASEVKGVKRSNSKSHKRDALTNGEVLAVVDSCDVASSQGLRDKAMLTLMAYCALRQVEVHRANIGDVRTRGDRLTLSVQGKGHTDADDYVVIPVTQEPVVRDWLSERRKLKWAGIAGDDPLFVSFSNRTYGKRLALSSIRNMVKRRYAQAGVVGDTKSSHSLRHSAITNAIRRGATPMQVQAMSRHVSYDTTLIYYHEVSRLDAPAEDRIDYHSLNGER